MPSPLHNGGEQLVSGASRRKVRRFGALLLLLRLAAFCFCLAAVVFAATDASVLRLVPFRLVLATNAIVAAYSLFEVGATTAEVLKGSTLMPEVMQLWFDFAHDQAFGYMAVAAGAAAAREATMCSGEERGVSCLQAYIAVGLGFAGFAFLALAALASGFRLVCFLTTGSRFPSS